MTRRARRPACHSPACLALAGLLLCPPAWVSAGEAPPARSIAAEPLPVGASRAELEQLREDQAGLAAAQSRRLDEQAQRLSRNAQALDEAVAAIKALQSSRAQAQGALDSARQRLDELAQRLQSLDQAQARSGREAAVRDGRLDAVVREQGELRLQQEQDRDALQAALKSLESTRKELDERSAKLASLAELLGVMKKDLESNHEQLIELKQDLKPAVAAAPSASGAWHERALRWPYLPAVAVGLSLGALGVAASR
jgi:DNA anti-recombination protein RmuC